MADTRSAENSKTLTLASAFNSSEDPVGPYMALISMTSHLRWSSSLRIESDLRFVVVVVVVVGGGGGGGGGGGVCGVWCLKVIVLSFTCFHSLQEEK